MRTARCLAACSLLVGIAAVHAQEMQPGLWEISTTMKMQGMQLPANKMTHCYTAQDIAAGKHYKGDDASKCTIANLKAAGGNISYDMTCAIEGGKMTGTVKGKVTPTTFEFDQKMRMTPDEGMGDMHSIVKGRRLGDCKK